MAWESWTSLYNKWLDALATRDINAFFHSSTENSREMRVTYSTINNIESFTSWLKAKSDQEQSGVDDGELLSCIGGC
jgi:hypothetical protein